MEMGHTVLRALFVIHLLRTEALNEILFDSGVH